MDTTKFTMGIVGLVVIILMVTGAVIPAVENSETIVTEATFSNEDVLTTGEFGSYSTTSVNLVFDLSADTATTIGDAVVTYNGENVNMRSGFNRHMVVVTNSLYIDIDGAGYSNKIFYVTGIDSTDTFNKATGISFGNYVYTISYDASAKTVSLSSTADGFTTLVFENQDLFWSIAPKNQYSYSNSAANMASVYVGQKDIENKTVGILASNATLTIDDSSYYFECVYDKSGVHVITDYTGEYTVTYSWGNNLTLVDGSTDVYKGAAFTFTLSVDGSDTTLTPLRTFLKYEVEGHEVTNSEAALFAIIPLLLIIVAVLYAVRLMGASRN